MPQDSSLIRAIIRRPLSALALASLAACGFEPAGLPEEVLAGDAGTDPGADARAGLDLTEAYPATTATEAATAVAGWHRIACAGPGTDPCFEGRDRDQRPRVRIAVIAPGSGTVELRITATPGTTPPLADATVRIDLDGSVAPADQSAVRASPVAAGFVRDVVTQPVPEPPLPPPPATAEQRAALTTLLCLARASATSADTSPCGTWQRDATDDRGLVAYVDAVPARAIVLVLRDPLSITSRDAVDRWRQSGTYQSAWSTSTVYQPAVPVPTGALTFWRTQARKPLRLAATPRNLVDRSLRLAAFRRAPLSVTLVARGPGAAGAILAGFDLHQRLASLQPATRARYTVDVHAFDAPFTSLSTYAPTLQSEYLRALQAPSAPLRLHLFRKTGDPHEALVLGADHPVSRRDGDGQNGSRTQQGAELPYCPVFTAAADVTPPADPLAAWTDEVARMPAALIACAQPVR